MSLSELSANEFTELLASSEPVPGGGGAAALAGAVGAALASMKLLPEITEAFRSIDLESRNTAVCEMLCAHFPDAERQARIRETLCRLHHRDEILLDIKTDPELLGGFILKIDNVTYDRSVRRSLRDMARYLQERRII